MARKKTASSGRDRFRDSVTDASASGRPSRAHGRPARAQQSMSTTPVFISEGQQFLPPIVRHEHKTVSFDPETGHQTATTSQEYIRTRDAKRQRLDIDSDEDDNDDEDEDEETRGEDKETTELRQDQVG